jgi:hypothetical protein
VSGAGAAPPDPGGTRPPAGADTVYFLSDYGRHDEFVGVVHAVLRRLAPTAAVIDLSHDVPVFDVRAGAFLLTRAVPHLGPGVVLAVVDPGVGGARRGVVVEVAGTGPRWFVGPDNGLLLAAAASGGIRRAVALAADDGPDGPGGVTFDGRDVFAPAAAALCNGADPGDLGVALDPSSLVSVPDPVVEWSSLEDGRRVLRSEVAWVDRFGNVQLAVTADQVSPAARAIVVGPGANWPDLDPTAAGAVPVVHTFGDLTAGEPGLLADANGHLALVVREGSAAARFGLGPGTLVELIW